MLFFAVLVLSAAADARIYRRADTMTGEMLECQRCPPGTRLGAHCTRSRQTECVPCPAGLFTEFWNYIPHCLLCDACADHQRVVRPCNGTANTVCECERGFYWDQHFCRRHSACPPGHGVKEPGTPHRDTVCEACADGQYAVVREAQAMCVAHSVCQTDQYLLLPGTRSHDNICMSCQQLKDGGWVGVLSPVLQRKYRTHRSLCRWSRSVCRRAGYRRPQDPLVLPLVQRVECSVQRLCQSCSNTLSL